MENQIHVRNITLKDLWELLMERLWIIVLAAVIMTVGLWIGDNALRTPEYESTATLYILRQNGETSSSDVSSDFSLALKVVNDCSYMLTSHSVLDALIEELDLDVDYDTLRESIHTYNPEDTRFLEVTVTHTSAQEAKRIVDALVDIGSVKINEAMGFRQVNLYEYGTIHDEPEDGLGLIACVLAGIITGLLVYCVYLVVFLVDDRIRKEEDIERYLGVNVLGDICSVGDAAGKKMYAYGPQKTLRKSPRKER